MSGSHQYIYSKGTDILGMYVAVDYVHKEKGNMDEFVESTGHHTQELGQRVDYSLIHSP